MSLKARVRFPDPGFEPAAGLAAEYARAAHGFRVHGTLLLENCFERDRVHALGSAFERDYASRRRDEVERTCLKVGEERFMFSIRLEPPFADPALYANPHVLPIVRELLGEDCVVQSLGAVCAYPGSPQQHVHRDHPHLFPEAGGLNALLPPYALHVVVPLIDLDESTGTTALWEGSHRIRSRREENLRSPQQLDQLEGAVLPWPKAGDCYLMDFRLRHAGTANVSNRPRTIVYVVYSRRWFHDRKNYDLQSPLAVTREQYEAIPETHRPLFDHARPRN